MTYLLDTNIVSYFLQAGRDRELAAASKHCPMALVGEVARELTNDPGRGGKPFSRWLASSDIAVRPLVLGTPAFEVFEQLRSPNEKDSHAGERASIALAAYDASLTFVANDKGAMWLALRELWAAGERILGVHVFLRRLFEAEALTEPRTADEVLRHANIKQPPTWWATWRASLSPGPLEAA